MTASTATASLGSLVGAALAVFGMWMLIRGRAPGLIGRSFRTVRDAGRYHLFFGLALVLLVVAGRLPGERPGTIVTLLAILLAAVAVVLYRPRRRDTSARD